MRSLRAQMVLSVGAFILVGASSVAAKPLAPTGSHAVRDAHLAGADTSVTGCLQKGAMSDDFILQDKDGKRYKVMSKSVALAGHVGHTVTLAGAPGTESAGEIADKGAQATRAKDSTGMTGTNDSTRMQGMGMHAPDLQVTKLTMVSATCK